MHTQFLEDIMPREIKQNVQLNESSYANLEKVIAFLQHEHRQQIDEGQLAIPPYAIKRSDAISACLERFHDDLANGCIDKLSLQRYLKGYAEQTYSHGTHSYFPEEAAAVIPLIANHVLRLIPASNDIIFWRSRLSHKAIVTIALYYVSDYIDKKTEDTN